MNLESLSYIIKRYLFCRKQIRRIADCGQYMMEASQLHKRLLNQGLNPQQIWLQSV